MRLTSLFISLSWNINLWTRDMLLILLKNYFGKNKIILKQYENINKNYKNDIIYV